MEKRLYRIEPSALGGVCKGLAEYFNIDVTIVRLLFVLSILLSGLGVLLYVILWIVVPQLPKDTEPINTDDVENKKE